MEPDRTMPADFANTPTLRPKENPDDYIHWPVPDRRVNIGELMAVRAYNALAELVDRDDGWVRLIPSRDGSPIYAKYKFTHGDHTGRYVMVLVKPYDFDELLPQLAHALARVDAGTLKPTVDKYYAHE